MKRKIRIGDVFVRLFFISMVLALVYVVVAPWLRPDADVNTIYGRRRSRARTSVNGTSVFAEMFAQRRWRVTTWRQLSPRLRRSEVIVWTPDSFELPSAEEIEYLESDWLAADDYRPRTLIYVGRDYDASIDYWERQANTTGGEAFLKSRNQLAREHSDHAYARSLTGKETDSKWFAIKSDQRFERVEPTRGSWAPSIDSRAAAVRVAGALQLSKPNRSPHLQHELLLGSEETPLIVRLTNEVGWPDGQILVLLNGFSVLNLPLVNHEHRKIASKLIDACGDPGRVTFLETGAGGPRISRQDPKAYSGFEALTVWPINSILLHLIIAGILFCLMVFPIFGRPRELDEDPPSDFSKHIRAIGDLLALASDRQAALAQIQQYRSLNLETTPTRHELPKTEPEPTPGNPFKATI